MGVGDEAEGGVLLAPAALGAVLPEHGDGGGRWSNQSPGRSTGSRTHSAVESTSQSIIGRVQPPAIESSAPTLMRARRSAGERPRGAEVDDGAEGRCQRVATGDWAGVKTEGQAHCSR